MARIARKISETGFYHVIIRGVNKETIFMDDEDRKMFLRLLKKYKTELECNIYAYCLMSNHVHILLEDQQLNIGELMKNITCVYAGEFNKRHGRVGHLFQDRFKSQNVENQNYLLRLIRYIHRNPEKAGICKTEDYKWSSYNEVIYGSEIIDREFILNIYNGNKFYAIKQFREQITGKQNDMIDAAFIEEKISDTEARALIEHFIETKQIPEITEQSLAEVVYKIRQIKYLNIDQILRILEVSRTKYYREIKK